MENFSGTPVLVMSGSYGNENSSFSGLTKENKLEQDFFAQSCELVGVSSQKGR
jgi:hypothetical protein